MNINIISIGKFGKSDLSSLFNNYVKKTSWKISLTELEIKNSNSLEITKKKDLEAKLILKNINKSSKVIILDENGKQHKSKEFATLLNNFAINGDSNITFVIGGADGLSDEILKMSNNKISFSKMTFPHLMVRVMLAEQLYRAVLIINNHPYHRE